MPYIKVVEFQNGSWGVRVGRWFPRYVTSTGNFITYRIGTSEFANHSLMSREQSKQIACKWRARFTKEK